MKNTIFILCLLALSSLLPLNTFAQCNPDVTPPTADCRDISTTLLRNGKITIWANDLNRGSIDNCTSNDDLKYSFDAAGLIVNEIFDSEGSFQRVLYVTDEAGNQNSCQTTIEVVCPKSLACNDVFVVKVAPNDSVLVSVWDVLEGSYCPDVVPSFTHDVPNDTTITIHGGDSIPVQYVVYDVNSGNSCWGQILNCFDNSPIAIADADIELALDKNGIAYLTALTVDNGSYSLCGTVEVLIKRNNSFGECDFLPNDFRPEIKFCCKDLGKTIDVILQVTDFSGMTNTANTKVTVVNKTGISFDCASVSGKVYLDENDNCINDAGDKNTRDILVIATNGVDEYVGETDENGQYKIFLPFGTFNVYPISPGFYWSVCPSIPQISVDMSSPDEVEDFGFTESIDCPLMNVEVVNQRLRRCFTNKAFINYVNTGTIEGKDARIELKLDKYLELISASETYIDLGNNIYEFKLGNIQPFESGRITLNVRVDCGRATLGETQCIEARIFPNEICGGDFLQWSGADVEVNMSCEGDSIKFLLKNKGTAEMKSAREYHVIEDDVIMFMKQFKLGAGKEMSFSLATNGSTYRFNAQQEIDHPFPFIQSVAIEGCINGQSGFSKGFVTMFPMGAQEPFKDIECVELIGSYDPNEKTASPKGFGSPHYLEPGNPITYTLYFQNTGTDTAFNVFIIDELSEHLDLATFKLGASSHPVDVLWQEGRVVRFDFANIMLPDSNVNQLGSNGFVEFTISPKEELPLPTEITNAVDIYFDFNEPVETNIVTHTIDTGFVKIITSTDWTNPDFMDVKVGPNPTNGNVTWKWEKQHINNGTLEIVDLIGQCLKQKYFTGKRVQINLGNLLPGYYLYRLIDEETMMARGKVIVK